MTSYQPGGDAPLYIGVDLGGSTLRAGLVDATGAIVDEREAPTEAEEARPLINQLVRIVKELQEASAGARLAGVGVGLPGLVNTETKQAVVLPNLPDLSSVDLHGELARATDLPVIFDNNANASAYGEFLCGAGRGSRNLFFVSIGTGIGSGIILDGRLWRGANGYAGEFGHMTIDPENGIECGCGNWGCLETMCSAPNIVRRARERLYRDRTSSLSRLALPRDREFTGDDIGAAAANGDEMAQVILERTGMYLGIALAAVINLLNVELIVFDGAVVRTAGDLLLKPTIEHTGRRAFQPSFQACRIVASQLADRAGLIGAAFLARDEGARG